MTALRGVLGFALLLLSGCGEEPVTEIFACYSVDEALASARGEVRICAQTSDMERVLFGCDGSPIGQLGDGVISQGFVQSRASGVVLELSADVPGAAGGVETVVQRAIVPFQRDRVVAVSLEIEAACRASGCPSGTTCAGGSCVSEAVDPGCLGDLGGPPVEGCTDVRVTRGCAGL